MFAAPWPAFRYLPPANPCFCRQRPADRTARFPQLAPSLPNKHPTPQLTNKPRRKTFFPLSQDNPANPCIPRPITIDERLLFKSQLPNFASGSPATRDQVAKAQELASGAKPIFASPCLDEQTLHSIPHPSFPIPDCLPKPKNPCETPDYSPSSAHNKPRSYPPFCSPQSLPNNRPAAHSHHACKRTILPSANNQPQRNFPIRTQNNPLPAKPISALLGAALCGFVVPSLLLIL